MESADSSAISLDAVTESVIKPIIRRKLRVSLAGGNTSSENQDALELVGDAQVILLSELGKASPANGRAPRNVKSYAAVVTNNICYQYLRARFPVRTQQRNKLRYVLSHHRRFGIWSDGSGNWICGLKEWQYNGAEIRRFPVDEIDDLADMLASDDRNTYLKQIEQVFDRTGGPLPVDDLLEVLMRKNGIGEQRQADTNLGDHDDRLVETIPDTRPAIDVVTETVERVKHLWLEIEKLPLMHRKALLLNLKGRQDEGLITIFPICGAASIRKIAASLDFPADEFAAIWNSLPWDDLAIAEHLGITRQQVINLRQSARARLLRSSK